MTGSNPDWNARIARQAPSGIDEIRGLYDDFAATYDDTVTEWNYMAPRAAAAYLKKYLPSTARILDAGCGTGLTGAALRAAGFSDINGIDLSEKSVQMARASGHYREARVGDLSRALEFEEHSFDGLICVGVLTYIANLTPVLLEFIRVTRPGGILVFTQRDDLYRKCRNEGLFTALAQDGQCTPLCATEPQPYLPGHPDFGTEIGVRYFVWQVPESRQSSS